MEGDGTLLPSFTFEDNGLWVSELGADDLFGTTELGADGRVTAEETPDLPALDAVPAPLVDDVLLLELLDDFREVRSSPG